MRIGDMNWMQVEAYLKGDDRCVLPFGSTEQHAHLLCVDAILAERVAVEAAAPLGVPVFPVMPFGLAPYFAAFPGASRCASRRCSPWPATSSPASRPASGAS